MTQAFLCETYPRSETCETKSLFRRFHLACLYGWILPEISAYRCEEGIVGELGPKALIACRLTRVLQRIFPLLYNHFGRRGLGRNTRGSIWVHSREE